jgi:hypothetical protein
MKGRNNTRQTRKTKEVINRMTGGLRPLTHDAEQYHQWFLEQARKLLKEISFPP